MIKKIKSTWNIGLSTIKWNAILITGDSIELSMELAHKFIRMLELKNNNPTGDDDENGDCINFFTLCEETIPPKSNLLEQIEGVINHLVSVKSELLFSVQQTHKNGTKTNGFASIGGLLEDLIGYRDVLVANHFDHTNLPEPIITPEKILTAVQAIDRAIGGKIEGGYITGCYRGKTSQNYRYCVTSKTFEYDNAPSAVANAFKKAHQ